MNKHSADNGSDFHCDGYNKIEIVDCPHECRNCKKVLGEINRLFYDSYQYQNDKEYQFSVDALKKAFHKTNELVDPVEQDCARMFRGVITDSLENILTELKRMTKGFFRKNRYKESYRFAEETLQEFKMAAPAGKLLNVQFPPVLSEDQENNLVEREA